MTLDNEDEEAVELLGQLVAIDSVNPAYGGQGEARLADFVEAWLVRRGVKACRQKVLPGRENIYARVGPPEMPALLLEAHMDTVGVSGWARQNPFALERSGSRYFGRGSCDTKASLACFMLTAARFASGEHSMRHALVFAATVDEESEQLGASELAKLKDKLGIAWAITGEPTCSDLISRHKGVGRYVIETSGKAAHASKPEDGENAIYKAARICGRLDALARGLAQDDSREEIEKGSLNVGVMQGGSGFNVVPSACQLDVDRRFGASEDPAFARRELEKVCATEPGTRMKVFLERPPLRGVGVSDFVATMKEAARQTGQEINERVVPYMTNAVSYEAAGIPSLVFGPGDIAQAHKVDEYIEAGEMERCLAILRAFLSA